MIVNSGKWHCGVWERCAGKLLSAEYVNSGFTSGVRCDLSLVVDGFRCKRCDRTILEADLAEHLLRGGIWSCMRCPCLCLCELVKQLAIFLGVVVTLLLNVMELLCWIYRG